MRGRQLGKVCAMKSAALGLALLALASILSGCGTAGTILYCIAVDGDASRKCN